jgi:uncharacterized membrane protein YbhN (UPF0104 family)
MSFHDGSKEN